MRLSVKIEGAAYPVPAEFVTHRVSLERQLGKPVLWKLAVSVAKELGEERKLARALEGGPCTAQPFWHGRRGDPLKLGRPSRVVGARWLDRASGLLELTATTTVFDKSLGEDPFQQRRLVHHVKSYLELGRRFSYIAEPGVLENILDDMKLPEKERVCVVQDGLSDWDFFAGWLTRCAALIGESLILTGAAHDAARSPWVITSGSARLYRELGDVPNRSVRLGGGDDVVDFTFESWEELIANPSLPRNDTHVICQTFPARAFGEREWNDWRQQELPLFRRGGGAMIIGVRDHLLDGAGDHPSWVTDLFGLPAESYYPLPPRSSMERPWASVGVVEESDPTSPWIRVKLADFAGRHGDDDVVWARASTLYSGVDGAGGLHLVPEIGTPLAVAWSGKWEEPVFVIGNLRYKEATTPAPSLTLESEARARVEEVLIESQRVALKSQGEVAFDADGVKVALSGGKFKTGL